MFFVYKNGEVKSSMSREANATACDFEEFVSAFLGGSGKVLTTGISNSILNLLHDPSHTYWYTFGPRREDVLATLKNALPKTELTFDRSSGVLDDVNTKSKASHLMGRGAPLERHRGTPQSLGEAIENALEEISEFSSFDSLTVDYKISVIRQHVKDFLAQKFSPYFLLQHARKDFNLKELWQRIVGE